MNIPGEAALSWRTIVELYARRGTWCQTARLLYPGATYPARLVEQCKAARRDYLAGCHIRLVNFAPVDGEERES